MEINEPEILKEDILIIEDPHFKRKNVCIVTGCGSGIGKALAIAAAVNGLMVVGVDINAVEAESTAEIAEALGGSMHVVRADLTQDADIEKAVDAAAASGTIRYLANIAGIQHIDAVEDFPMTEYDRMQKLMLRAPFLLSKLAIPYMRQSADGVGVIANMASVHAHITTLNKPVYNIVKFGLRGLSQSISAEGGGKIRSFTVSTGFVKTGLALNQVGAQALQRGITPDAVVSEVMMGKSRVKEMMSPIEVANLFTFGFSRYASYLVGGDLLFDGGVVLTY